MLYVIVQASMWYVCGFWYVCMVVVVWWSCLQTQQPTPVRAIQDDVEIETRTDQSDSFAVSCNI